MNENTSVSSRQVESLSDQSGSISRQAIAYRSSLYLQYVIDWIMFPIVCNLIAWSFYWIGGYRIVNRNELRRQFKDWMQDPTPTIICANHLTYIDSALAMWAFASNWYYFFRFKHMSWNLPAGDYFGKRWYFRVIAYLTKCIFIHRDGSKLHKDRVLEICHQLLQRGEVVSIFPEGRRSRSGRFEVDHLTYGVAKLIERNPGCRVICVYIRSDKQKGYSGFPPRNSRFRILTHVLHPRSSFAGRQKTHDLLKQVADTIVELENQHFQNLQ